VEQQVIDTLTYGQLLNLNFYLDIGTYEPELLPPLQYTVVPLLNSRGYPYQFETYPEGHSWGNWRAHIDNALERFFPGPGLKIPKRSEIPSIYQNLKVYPNPFNEKSHITFTLPKDSIVSLTIYDLQGRKISNLWDGFCDYGSHQTTFDGSSLASGIYFIQLIADSFHQTQKLVLMK
jgi:enterochelin esterase family protein